MAEPAINVQTNHITPELIANCSLSGTIVGCWFETDNGKESAELHKRILTSGVDFFITDQPLEVLEMRTYEFTSVTRRISQHVLPHLDVKPEVNDAMSEITENSYDSEFSSLIFKDLDLDLDAAFAEPDSRDMVGI